MSLHTMTFDEFYFRRHQKEIENIVECYMADDISKAVYQELIRYRMSDSLGQDPEIVSENIYFSLPQFKADFRKKGVFIDAGAFVGDIVEKYLFYYCDFFDRIYAFEPCAGQYQALQKRVKRLNQEWALDENKIHCVQAALSDRSGFCKMESGTMTPAGSYMGQMSEKNDDSIAVVTLDEYVKEPVQFIKADVEGSELRMLMGAKNIIQKYRPKLAVCLYHRPQDFIEIPQYLKKIVPEYEMAVRHYSYSYEDTVLYCWIKN